MNHCYLDWYPIRHFVSAIHQSACPADRVRVRVQKKNGNGTGENRGERDELTSGDQRELPPARRDRETEVIAADSRGSAVEREISVSRRACEKEARAAGVTKRKSRSALMMWAWPGGSPRHMGVLSPHRT